MNKLVAITIHVTVASANDYEGNSETTIFMDKDDVTGKRESFDLMVDAETKAGEVIRQAIQDYTSRN